MESFPINLQISVIKLVLQLEKCTNFLAHVPKIVDHETWGKINEALIRLNNK